jgi:hypothetical protein
LGVRCKAETLLCKTIIVAKSREVKIGCNLAGSSKEDCGLKKGCFANDDDVDFDVLF